MSKFARADFCAENEKMARSSEKVWKSGLHKRRKNKDYWVKMVDGERILKLLPGGMERDRPKIPAFYRLLQNIG